MSATETSLVLLISHEEWAARSFESILKPHGFVVLKAYTGSQGLELAEKIRPDIGLIEHRLPDMIGGEVCQRIQELPTVRPSTPMLVYTTGSMSRRDRLAQVKLGAWEVLSPPFDPEEVLVRMERYVAAKRDTDAALEESHVDPPTGLYNRQGLVKRVAELMADASRSGRELGCVVMGPVPEPGTVAKSVIRYEFDSPKGETLAARPQVARALAQVMTRTTRLSDTIGRVGESEYLILAPGIDEQGTRRLAERLLEALKANAEQDDGIRPVRLQAETYAVGVEQEGLSPEEFVSHATMVLRKTRR